jgi:hypothetical protein
MLNIIDALVPAGVRTCAPAVLESVALIAVNTVRRGMFMVQIRPTYPKLQERNGTVASHVAPIAAQINCLTVYKDVAPDCALMPVRKSALPSTPAGDLLIAQHNVISKLADPGTRDGKIGVS